MNIWKFASGYVKIRIMGEYPERLVNKAVANRVGVSRAVPLSEGGISCEIPMQRMRDLSKCAKGCGCRVHITSKHGLPCAGLLIKRRRVLAAAAFAVLILCCFASTRLLAVKVVCDGYDRAVVMQKLDEAGLHIGMPMKDADSAELTKQINGLSGVEKAEVTKHGVVLCVAVTGSALDRSLEAELSNEGVLGVYAAKDCVVTSVSIVRGRALVKAGDRVSAGQLLISGDYSDLKQGYSVDAEGSVFGRVLYRSTAEASREDTVLCRTGAGCRFNTIELFGHELFAVQPYAEYELEPVSHYTLSFAPIPVYVKSYNCRELAYTETDIGETAAMINAQKAARDALFGSIPKDAELVSVKTEYSADENGAITATVTAVCIENVSRRREIKN